MLSKTVRVLFFAVLALGVVRPADAQYFGRNKVQYEKFDWRIVGSPGTELEFAL